MTASTTISAPPAEGLEIGCGADAPKNCLGLAFVHFSLGDSAIHFLMVARPLFTNRSSISRESDFEIGLSYYLRNAPP